MENDIQQQNNKDPKTVRQTVKGCSNSYAKYPNHIN